MTGRTPTPVVPLGDLLVLSAARAPENVVLAFPDSRATTRELLAAATGMAQGLHALGVRRGDRVGILMPNCPAFVEALFGASLLGAVPVLINARYRTEELAYVTANASLRVILTNDLIADRVDFAALLEVALPGLSDAEDPRALSLPATPSLRACVLLGETDAPGFLDAAAFARGGAGVPEQAIDDAAAAVAIRDDGILMYTSGTSAHPKGCRLSHEAVVRTAAAMVERYRLTSDDVWWCPLPLCHMSGVLPLAATLIADSRLACMTDFEPGAALRQLEQERATFHFGIFPTDQPGARRSPRLRDDRPQLGAADQHPGHDAPPRVTPRRTPERIPAPRLRRHRARRHPLAHRPGDAGRRPRSDLGHARGPECRSASSTPRAEPMSSSGIAGSVSEDAAELAGGMVKAVERAHEIGAERAPDLRRQPDRLATPDRAAGRSGRPSASRLVELDIGPVAIHASYLVNLAGPEEDFFDRSVGVLASELRAAPWFAARYVNVHIGSHRGRASRPGSRGWPTGSRSSLAEVDADARRGR